MRSSLFCLYRRIEIITHSIDIAYSIMEFSIRSTRKHAKPADRVMWLSAGDEIDDVIQIRAPQSRPHEQNKREVKIIVFHIMSIFTTIFNAIFLPHFGSEKKGLSLCFIWSAQRNYCPYVLCACILCFLLHFSIEAIKRNAFGWECIDFIYISFEQRVGLYLCGTFLIGRFV